jgi:hypothetical protein
VTALASGLPSGLALGFVAALMVVALGGLVRPTEVDASPLGPAHVWYQDRNVALGGWFGFVLVSLLLELVPGFGSGLVFVLLAGLALALALVLWRMVELKGAHEGVWASAAPDTAGALVHLAIRHKTPLQLIRFLEDARSRRLLRTVGPVYQFRHASLQARLAQPTANEPSRT